VSASAALTRRVTAPGQERIPADEVVFQPHSFADPGGRLFSWRGGLYRGLRGQSARLIDRLLADGALTRLVERGLLVDTTRTDLQLAGFELVVAHRRLPFVSYPQEWPAPMLQRAALTILELARELAPLGLTIKDAHPWNLLYEGCQPRWVDLTSIAPATPILGWPARDEFERFCLNPLRLIAAGQDRIARLLLCEAEGVRPADLHQLGLAGRPAARELLQNWVATAAGRLPPRARARFLRVGSQFAGRLRERRPGAQRTLTDSLESLARQTAALDLALPHSGRTGASDRPGWPFEPLLARTLPALSPSSSLLVGAPTSLAFELAKPDPPVVVFDLDEQRLAAVYRRGQAARLPLLPLLVDFSRPTPASGLLDHWFISAADRLRCDLVLALGAIEDLVDRRQSLLVKVEDDHRLVGLGQLERQAGRRADQQD
jgi:hypothetical protein